MKKVLWVAFGFIGIVLVLSGLIAVGPTPSEVKIYLSLASVSTILNIGVAVVLFMALGGFKHRLRVAYWYICTSQLLLAASIGQSPVIAILDAFDSFWVRYGFDHAPFVLACIFGYIGLRVLARLLNVKSWLLNPWTVLSLSMGLAVLGVFIPAPHADQSVLVSVVSQRLSLPLLEIIGIFLITALAFQIKQQAATLYTKAFKWFFWGYLIYLGANIFGLALSWLPPDSSLAILAILPILLFPMGALALLVSAVNFNRIRYIEKLIVTNTEPQKMNHGTSSVDVLITVAQLASRPADIDVTLDNVRVVTSRLDKTKVLSPADQTTLAQTYLKLEKFLVNDEPARKFAAQDLRQMLDIRFRSIVDEPVFWNIIDNTPIQSIN